MPRLATSLALLAAILAAPAAHAAERRFAVGAFDRIALRGSPDVQVATGRAASVRAEGDQDLIDRLEVETRDGELTIGLKRSDGRYRMNGRLTVFVTTPALAAARVAGSGDMSIDRIAGGAFDGGVSGAGDLSVGRLDVGQARLSLSGSGDIQAAGRCVEGRYELSGSGDVRAGDLACRAVSARLIGSGDIAARASGNADAVLVGSGDISIAGGARCTQRKRGTGSISCG